MDEAVIFSTGSKLEEALAEDPFLHGCVQLLESGEAGDVQWGVQLFGDPVGFIVLAVHFAPAREGHHRVEFDPTTGEWLVDSGPASGLAELFVFRSGEVSLIGAGIRLRLTHPRDLLDVIDFVRNARRLVSAKGSYQSFSLSRLVSAVTAGCLVEGERLPLPISDPRVIKRLPQEVRHYLDVLVRGDAREIIFDLDKTWGELCRDHGQVLSELCPARGDRIRERDPSNTPAADYFHRSGGNPVGEDTFSTGIAVNPKRVFAPYLGQLMEITQEGRRVRERLLSAGGSVEELPQLMASDSLFIQSDRQIQVREAFELATTQQALRKRMEAVATRAEPAAHAQAHLRLRLRLSELLEDSYREESHALLRPLPYFLEKSYRHFLRAGDGREQVASGIVLLSLLTKVMVLLPLEELLGRGTPSDLQDAVRDARDRVEGPRPLTDGDWLQLFGTLRTATSEQLVTTAPIVEAFGSDYETIARLINQRNEWAHSARALSPSFISDLVADMEASFRQVMHGLRVAFEPLELVIPKSLRSQGGERLLTARSIMGGNPEFELVERPAPLPLDAYPTGELVLLSDESPVVLSRYFRCESRATDVLDIRVFDRVQDGQLTYFSVDFDDVETG